jgi:hypothetical protein
MRLAEQATSWVMGGILALKPAFADRSFVASA